MLKKDSPSRSSIVNQRIANLEREFKASGGEFKEFCIGDLFDVENTWIYGKNKNYITRYDKPSINSVAVISGITTNNGVNYYTNDKLPENEIFKDCLTISTRGEYSGTVTYHSGKFVLANNILVMPMPNWSNRAQLFIATAINALNYGGYSNYPKKETLKNDKILLPTLGGKINFSFMEKFIEELDAYLRATGLKNYELTQSEKSAFAKFDEFSKRGGVAREFTLESLFDNIRQGRRLKKQDQKAGAIPFIMAGVTNNGVANYISNPVAKFPANSITVDIFGNTFYRDYEFGAGDDTGVYYNVAQTYTKETMLYFTTVISKSLFGKFSYGQKLRSSQSLNFKIKLPTKNGEIDYEFMENFIKAIEKLAIKDVVLWADKKIETTKKIINKA
ncbi:restriction endonuclease subunit S [Campylobacter concisus]|uniref:restriction endonuclease subunit S n=1 Tax=Campylobacter concisus TaxID=199 RepID=UPI001CB72CB9|nr:restriction endonuclease subunit S [Campylobacter concisus]